MACSSSSALCSLSACRLSSRSFMSSSMRRWNSPCAWCREVEGEGWRVRGRARAQEHDSLHHLRRWRAQMGDGRKGGQGCTCLLLGREAQAGAPARVGLHLPQCLLGPPAAHTKQHTCTGCTEHLEFASKGTQHACSSADLARSCMSASLFCTNSWPAYALHARRSTPQHEHSTRSAWSAPGDKRRSSELRVRRRTLHHLARARRRRRRALTCTAPLS